MLIEFFLHFTWTLRDFATGKSADEGSRERCMSFVIIEGDVIVSRNDENKSDRFFNDRDFFSYITNGIFERPHRIASNDTFQSFTLPNFVEKKKTAFALSFREKEINKARVKKSRDGFSEWCDQKKVWNTWAIADGTINWLDMRLLGGYKTCLLTTWWSCGFSWLFFEAIGKQCR